jgi:hypothetical protein
LRFWDLTPGDVDRMALSICLLRPAVWGKKRLKPKDILGRPLVSEQRKKKRQGADTTED